jgi:hypothetical protein
MYIPVYYATTAALNYEEPREEYNDAKIEEI